MSRESSDDRGLIKVRWCNPTHRSLVERELLRRLEDHAELDATPRRKHRPHSTRTGGG